MTPVFEPKGEQPTNLTPVQRPLQPSNAYHSAALQVDPDTIPPQLVADNSTPCSESTTRYLTLRTNVTMDPKAPTKQKSIWVQSKRLCSKAERLPPQSARGRLEELQEKFDHLEQFGVFQRPEDVGITLEYLKPSFLVKEPNGPSRLVTAFFDVGRYRKPRSSLLPDGDSTLRCVALWSHILVTDLKSVFFFFFFF